MSEKKNEKISGDTKGKMPHMHDRVPTPPMLINRLSRLFDEYMRGFSQQGSLTQNCCRFIMRQLSHCGKANQSELAAGSGMKASTVSVAIKQMESEGLIERKRDESDKRYTCVVLTEKGKAVDEEMKSRLKEADAVMMRGISEEETKTLMVLLAKMCGNFREYRREGQK